MYNGCRFLRMLRQESSSAVHHAEESVHVSLVHGEEFDQPLRKSLLRGKPWDLKFPHRNALSFRRSLKVIGPRWRGRLAWSHRGRHLRFLALCFDHLRFELCFSCSKSFDLTGVFPRLSETFTGATAEKDSIKKYPSRGADQS